MQNPSRALWVTCGTLATGCVLLLAGCFASVQWNIWHNCWLPPTAPQLEILVSACAQPKLISFSTDGRYMLYSRPEANKRVRYLYDLQTRTEQKDIGCGDVWLDETLRVEYRQDPLRWHYDFFYICDAQTGTRIQLTWVPEIGNLVTKTGAIEFQPTGAMQQNTNREWVYSAQIVHTFQTAEHVYFVEGTDWAIALNKNFQTEPSKSFALSMPNATGSRNDVLQFLEKNKIQYTDVSFTGRAFVSRDGQYLFSATNQCPAWLSASANSCVGIFRGKENPFTSPLPTVPLIINYAYQNEAGPQRFAWAWDDSGVVFQFSTGENCFLFCLYYPVKPIFKLNIPRQN